MELHLPSLPSNYFDRQFLPPETSGGFCSFGDHDAKLISCDMAKDMADYVVGRAARILSRRKLNEQALPREIKEDMDRIYGPNWQVVITSGQFWAWFTHLPGSCIIFKCQRYCFLIWRTKTRPLAAGNA